MIIRWSCVVWCVWWVTRSSCLSTLLDHIGGDNDGAAELCLWSYSTCYPKTSHPSLLPSPGQPHTAMEWVVDLTITFTREVNALTTGSDSISLVRGIPTWRSENAWPQRYNPYNAKIFCINHGDQRVFQFEFIINVLVSVSHQIWIPICYGSTAILHFSLFQCRHRRQNAGIDVRIWRL